MSQQEHDPARRALLRQSIALAGAAALGSAARPAFANGEASAGTDAAVSDPHPSLGNTLTRIGFGSCSDETKPQPIWDAILAKPFDLFMFLGDNIYADTRDMEVLRAKYAMLGKEPGFMQLRKTTPIVAVWDDHDFGENDAGGDYPFKEQSRQRFFEFWGEPADSPRRNRDGVYASYVFGPPGKRVQVILPDLRYNRTPLVPLDLAGTQYKKWATARKKAGLLVPGPYARNPDHAATMLGERQWQWLERQFEVPAEVRLFASSLQVLADFPGWEAWVNFARDHDRLIDLIRCKNARGVVFLSGDTHYGEMSKQDVNVPYTLWDLTSSGITEVWPVTPPNANRVGDILREVNFGTIEIDWQCPNTKLTLAIHDVVGKARMSFEIDLANLA